MSATPLQFIDTHAHLAMLEHAPLEQVLENARRESVVQMVTVSTDEASWALNQALAEKYPHLYFTLGLHPHDSVDWPKCKEALKQRYANLENKSKCVAIGETGLDYFYEHSPRELQIAAFEDQVLLAQEFDLPLVIHCREAFADLFASLKKVGIPKRAGIMHCFTGTTEEALESIRLGFSISFSGIVTFKNSDALRETARLVTDEKLLIETDCPFLAPVPFRGKKNEPAYLVQTAHVLASVRKQSISELARITTENARRIFRLVS